MTLYSVPLSSIERDKIIHIRSAKKQYAMYLRSKNETHLILSWTQLLFAVSIGDI